MLGKTLAQIAGGDTAKLSQEQKRIEAELAAFRNNIFGDPEKKDSLDSVADLKNGAKKASKTKKEKVPRAKQEKASRRTKSSTSSPANASARVSVRRERH